MVGIGDVDDIGVGDGIGVAVRQNRASLAKICSGRPD
jgi:hypothetical protein